MKYHENKKKFREIKPNCGIIITADACSGASGNFY